MLKYIFNKVYNKQFKFKKIKNKIQISKKYTLTPEETTSYFKEIHEGDKSNHAIQYCLNYFGCRTNAMINLKWEHINFEMALPDTKTIQNDRKFF